MVRSWCVVAVMVGVGPVALAQQDSPPASEMDPLVDGWGQAPDPEPVPAAQPQPVSPPAAPAEPAPTQQAPAPAQTLAPPATQTAPAADPDTPPVPAGPEKGWEDYGFGTKGQVRARPGEAVPSPPPPDLTAQDIPWSVAIRVGALSALTIVLWQLVSPVLGLIPGAGVLAQFVGLGLPWFASGTGWWLGQRKLDIRAPLKAVLLAGLLQWGVDICCIFPLFVTPLMPLMLVSKCGVDALINGAATAFMVRRYGRMKGAGDPELAWDLWESPSPEEVQAQLGLGAGGAPSGGVNRNPVPGPPPNNRPPSPDSEEGLTVK